MPRNYTTTENTAEAQVKLTDIKDKRGRRRNTTWAKVKRFLKKRGLSIK